MDVVLLLDERVRHADRNEFGIVDPAAAVDIDITQNLVDFHHGWFILMVEKGSSNFLESELSIMIFINRLEHFCQFCNIPLVQLGRYHHHHDLFQLS